jgi:adenylate kinase
VSTPIKNDRAAWLQGPRTRCSVLPQHLDRAWRLVLLGAPGVGKGTQAQLFSRRLGGCHLSTGDVFRAAAGPSHCDPSPAMSQALQCMRQGELVPDSTVWAIVRERAGCIRCRGGFVLDGFPRTLAQAKAFRQFLDIEGLSLNAVLNYELPEAEIISRLVGRRVCENCKAVFHERLHPSRVSGVCDQRGQTPIQRPDDRPESVKVRLAAYARETAPLINFYKDHGLLVSVSAAGSPDEVFDRSLTALETAITDGLLRTRHPGDAIAGFGAHGQDPQRYAEPL